MLVPSECAINVSGAGFTAETFLRAPCKTRVGKQFLSEFWNLSNVVLPDGIRAVGKHWFSCTCVESVLIPPSVRKLGCKAFHHCQRLRRVIFAPESQLKRIAEQCFSRSSLEEFVAPPLLREICREAFYGCESLRVVVFNNCLKRIETGAFSGSAIEDVAMPDSVRVLGHQKAGLWGFSADVLTSGSKEIGV